jgi:hypothetical protein
MIAGKARNSLDEGAAAETAEAVRVRRLREDAQRPHGDRAQQLRKPAFDELPRRLAEANVEFVVMRNSRFGSRQSWRIGETGFEPATARPRRAPDASGCVPTRPRSGCGGVIGRFARYREWYRGRSTMQAAVGNLVHAWLPSLRRMALADSKEYERWLRRFFVAG